MAREIRDPLVPVYIALKHAVKTVFGKEFPVYDNVPDAATLKKQLPSANISYVSGSIDKALMREFIPHKLIDNKNGTYTVVTETVRFDYYMQVSFFAEKKGVVQNMSTKFIAYIETKNEIPIPNDIYNETMLVQLESPPMPPHGEPDLYQCDSTWYCRGKLLTSEIVNAIDVTNLRFRNTNI